MKAETFKKAVRMARTSGDLSGVDTTPLYGVGLTDFDPVTVPLEVVAAFVRYQCMGIFGDYWDHTEEGALKRMMCHPSKRVEVIEEHVCPHCGGQV